MKKERLVASACLCGRACRYDGKSNTVEEIKRLYEERRVLALCPEVLGGLSIPRLPCEVRGERVVRRDGADVTEAFLLGGERACQICQEHDISLAILKARSPSCGIDLRYDGTFTHTLCAADGLWARALRNMGIRLMTEENFSDFLSGVTLFRFDREPYLF